MQHYSRQSAYQGEPIVTSGARESLQAFGVSIFLAFVLALLPAHIRAQEFADSLSGGPDFYVVRGVAPGDRLNLRESPSAASRVLAGYANGTRLRNLGGRAIGGRIWRRVEDAAGRRGWANGRYLRE